MKKKWLVIPSLLALALVGTVAWQQYRPSPAVDGAMRAQAIDTLVARLNDHYVFPDKAKQIEAVLRQRQHEGKYDGMTDGEQLAKQLTNDLHGVAHDLHMKVEFSPGLVPQFDAGGPPPASQAEWEQRTNFATRLIVGGRLRLMNFGVNKVDHLSSNIGYLQVSGFPPAFLVAEKYAAAMDKLADTDALIIDLRDNGGGSPKSVALLISYFVDQRTRLNDIWDRDSGETMQFWTEDKLAGKRYGGKKPVVILVGPETKSAGEDFAYTMQAIKRATVIGERTWGGAHPTRPFRLGDHFFAVIPGRRTISPITHTNWEGVGVIPDVAATPADAMAVAKDLLQRRTHPAVALGAAN